MLPEDHEDQSKILRKYLRHTYLGTQFFVSIALLTGLGYWLDGQLGSLPAFTVLGLIIGFGSGAYSVYRALFPPPGREEKSGESRKEPGSSSKNSEGG